MWTRRRLLATFGIVALAGCAGGGSRDVVYYAVDPWDSPFYDDDWIYYYDEDDEDDDDFLAGLTDEQKDALRQKWGALSPEEKQQIRDRWNDLGADERARVREAWGGLDAEQRQRVVASMQTRVRSGTLRAVSPVQAGPWRFQARPGGGFDGGRARAGAGSFDRGSFGGRGGGGRGGRR